MSVMSAALVPCLCPVCCGKKVTQHVRRKRSRKLVGNARPRDQGLLTLETTGVKEFRRVKLERATQLRSHH